MIGGDDQASRRDRRSPARLHQGPSRARALGGGVDGEKGQHPQRLALHGLRDADHPSVALSDERPARIRGQRIPDPLLPAPPCLGSPSSSKSIPAAPTAAATGRSAAPSGARSTASRRRYEIDASRAAASPRLVPGSRPSRLERCRRSRSRTSPSTTGTRSRRTASRWDLPSTARSPARSSSLTPRSILPRWPRASARSWSPTCSQDARDRGLAVVPACPFVRDYIAGHPEHATSYPRPRRAAFGLVTPVRVSRRGSPRRRPGPRGQAGWPVPVARSGDRRDRLGAVRLGVWPRRCSLRSGRPARCCCA